MLSRWILAFGMRREQPKTRRAKETVKPQLEELTQRILLSAAASPQMAEEAMQMIATMMQEQYQLIVTVEDNFVQTYDTYIQRLAQLWASDVQQWKQFVGIEPASGSGSGSGTISTTNNSTDQQPMPIQPKSGSGMGSGATTSHENPSKSGSMPMSGSCGSGSGPIPEVYFGSGSNPFPEEPPMCGSVVATRGVFLSETTCHPVTVYYTTVDGTATAGTDYTYTSGSLTIPAGQISAPQPIKITILDDGNDESGGTQYFDVELTGAQGATVGTPYVSEVDIAEGLQQKPTDTLYWNPCMDNNASTVTNWYDYTQGFQLQNGALGVTSSSPIVFDGTPYSVVSQNAPINWDKSFTAASISVQNGFNALQTIYGEILEMDGVNGSTLTVDPSSTADFDLEGDLQTDTGTAEIDGTMYVNFLAAGKVDNIDGGTRNVKGDIDYGENGKVNVYNGGTLNLSMGAAQASDNQQSGSPIDVTNGTLNFGDGNNNGGYPTFQLTTASANINLSPNGTMNVYQTGGTPISNVLGGQGAVINNSGTVNLWGVAKAGGTTIAAPLQNHRTLNAFGGDWTFSQKDVTGNDLSMDDGSINTSFNPPQIYCSHGYNQTGGTFYIDTAQATLAVTGVPANFKGGTVSFGLSNGVLNTGGIAFNGAALKMSITANSTTSNVINSTSCSITNTSTITVTMVGSGGGGPWVLIKNPAGTKIVGDFSQPPNLPAGIVEVTPVTNVWSCKVK